MTLQGAFVRPIITIVALILWADKRYILGEDVSERVKNCSRQIFLQITISDDITDMWNLNKVESLKLISLKCSVCMINVILRLLVYFMYGLWNRKFRKTFNFACCIDESISCLVISEPDWCCVQFGCYVGHDGHFQVLEKSITGLQCWKEVCSPSADHCSGQHPRISVPNSGQVQHSRVCQGP